MKHLDIDILIKAPMNENDNNWIDYHGFLFLFLDYVPIGPRFSNLVLQALLVLLKKTPPKVLLNFLFINMIDVIVCILHEGWLKIYCLCLKNL